MRNGARICVAVITMAIGTIAWHVLRSSPVRAQQPDTTIKAEARLVLVDTVVTDKKGNYVRDLSQKDFRVWEDNKEQTIKSFSYESAGSPSPNAPTRYLVLFFDNSSMDFGEQARARAAAAKFIDANTGPNRVMAVIEFGGTLKIAQNFTSNADLLKRAVAGEKTSAVASNASPADNATLAMPSASSGVEVASLGAPPVGTSYFRNVESDFGARTVVLALRELAKNLASVPGRKTVVMLTSGFPLTPELQSEVTATIDACNKYNVAIYPIDARGLVAIVPGGPGAEIDLPEFFSGQRLLTATFTEDSARSRLIFVQHGTGGGGGGPHGGPVGGGPGGGTGGGHGGTGGAGGGGGTGGHGTGGGHGSGGSTGAGAGGTGTGGTPSSNYYNPNFQPRQLIPQIPPSVSDNQQVLFALANGTGGFVILNTNDLLGGMEKIAKELSEHYVIGYTPAATPEGSCHTLRVKVERGDTQVRSRTGYCSVKPVDLLAGKPVEKELENQANGTQSGTIAASMQAPYFYASANVARVSLAMEIPATAVKFEKVKGKQHATLNVLGITFKADNSPAARFSDALDFDLDDKKAVEEFQKQPVHYANQFDVASGQYTLKIVFSSGGQAFGKMEAPLVVEPYDGKEFGISSLALSKQVRRVSDLATGLDAALMEDHTPLVARGMEIVPTGEYRFKKTDMAALYTELYEPLLANANPPKVGFEMKVIDRKTGQMKVDSGLQSAEAFIRTGNPVIAIGLKIPLDRLEAGSYRVALQAVDSNGSRSKPRSADFELE